MDINQGVATARGIDLDVIERVCEEAITDPQGRGVRVDRFTDGGTDVYLSGDVPYGEIHEHTDLAR